MQSNNNPVVRRVRNEQETDGLLLLKQLTNPVWLRQPKEDMSIFALHKAQDVVKPAKEWSYQYDKNAAYLAASGSVLLGVSEYIRLTRSKIKDEHFNMPGLWRIDSRLILVKPFDILPFGESWQYTPVVKLLIEHFGLTAWQVKEAYVFPESHYVLRKLTDYLKDWRARDKEAAKACYTRLFGMLAHMPENSWPGLVYRPDWWHTIIAENKARIYRQAWKIYEQERIWPTGWNVDALYYDEKVTGFNLGTGIGQWKESRKEQ